MRIIAGKYKGRKLISPRNSNIRPTSDRARESIFNILQSYLHTGFDGLNVVDLFAGAGTLGIEAISRGADQVIFIDRDPVSIELVNKNLETIKQKATVVSLRREVEKLGLRPIKFPKCGLAFMDPPYAFLDISMVLESLVINEWLAVGAICVVETSKYTEIGASKKFIRLDTREYGGTMFHIFKFNELELSTAK